MRLIALLTAVLQDDNSTQLNSFTEQAYVKIETQLVYNNFMRTVSLGLHLLQRIELEALWNDARSCFDEKTRFFFATSVTPK